MDHGKGAYACLEGGWYPFFSGAVTKTAVLQNTKKNKKKKVVQHTKRCWRVPVNITKWEDWQTAWWSGKYHVRVPATDFNGNATENSLSVVAAVRPKTRRTRLLVTPMLHDSSSTLPLCTT